MERFTETAWFIRLPESRGLRPRCERLAKKIKKHNVQAVARITLGSVNPISRTAYYCCGVRADDAASAAPICGDSYAARFLKGEGEKVFEMFKEEGRPNRTNAARHRIIDDLVREELAKNPDRWIVVLGSGFDSRPYRLKGGRWVEVEEPSILEIKEHRLPSEECPNELYRLPISFSKGGLAEILADIPVSDPLIIVEGVLMYFTRKEVRELLTELAEIFPRHRVVCDMMTRSFFEKYSRSLHEKLDELGAHFEEMDDRPEALFEEHRYRQEDKISIIGRGARLRGSRIAPVLLKVFARRLAYGYAIYVFHTP